MLWKQRLFALCMEELQGASLLLSPAWARAVLRIWVVAGLCTAHPTCQSLGAENEHQEDN